MSMHKRQKQFLKQRVGLAPLAFALCLAACGGGGGGGVASSVAPPAAALPTVAPTPAPTPAQPAALAESFRTAEYRRMGALDAVHAAEAYALGYTGAGVLVGVVDFNFDFSVGGLGFHPDSVGPDPQAITLYEAQTGEKAVTDQHGLAIAATVAARKNDIGIHGIAFNADILGVDYFSAVNVTDVVQRGVTYHVSDPWTYITSRGARIINVSFGYDTGGGGGGGGVVDNAYITDTPAVGVANGALLVMSSGNNSKPIPSLFVLDTMAEMRAAGILDSGAGALIIAGAVDSGNSIASFSNRAGTAANYFLVAPGVAIIVPWNGSLAVLSGTSFSAPLISGAAAVVLQRWPQLTARQVAEVLFASAIDLGAPGVDAVYGHGLLNLEAALQPIGLSTLAVGGSGAPAVSATSLVLAPQFGDARALRSALTGVTMLDSFGRDFTTDLSKALVSRSNLPDPLSALESRLGWRSTGFQASSTISFAYGVRRNADDGVVPFQSLAGPAAERTNHQTMFRLNGVANGFDWVAGNGLSLREGMAGDIGYSGRGLSNPFSPAIGAAPGMFAGIGLALDENTRLSFGAAHASNQGLSGQGPRAPFDNSAETASMRLDHRVGRSSINVELGGVVESGGFMGSLASGGLKMAEQATSAWTTIGAETSLGAQWSLRTAFTFAVSAGSRPAASLITSVDASSATSFALGVARTNFIRTGDSLGFTLSQPLRAEEGGLAFATGVGRDRKSGRLIFDEQHISLTPSGREMDFETSYRFPLGQWSAEANLAYAVDSGHVKGENALLGLFTLSRAF